VVRRSNALRDWAYGRRFRYRETMSTGTSPLSPVVATGLKLGLGALYLGLSLPPTRFVLDRMLPKPGDGPSEKARREGHFTMDIYTTTTTGARYRARVRAEGDPGYAASALMLGESALALALDRDKLPPSEGGVLTPATGIGDALVDRLRDAGMLTVGAGDNVVRLLPPLTISADEVEQGCAMVEAACREFAG
jgi:short subunit dehydrogenase-like uncharacterized protein